MENKNKGIGKSSTRIKEKDAEKKEFDKVNISLLIRNNQEA